MIKVTPTAGLEDYVRACGRQEGEAEVTACTKASKRKEGRQSRPGASVECRPSGRAWQQSSEHLRRVRACCGVCFESGKSVMASDHRSKRGTTSTQGQSRSYVCFGKQSSTGKDVSCLHVICGCRTRKLNQTQACTATMIYSDGHSEKSADYCSKGTALLHKPALPTMGRPWARKMLQRPIPQPTRRG